jgi:hypothetical protein
LAQPGLCGKPHAIVFPDDQHSVAVMLYLVDPIRPGWDLLAGGRQTELIRHTHKPKMGSSAVFYQSGTSSNGARLKLLRQTPVGWGTRKCNGPSHPRLRPFFYIASGTIPNAASRIQAPDRPQVKSPLSREQTFPKVGDLCVPPRRSFAYHRIRAKKGRPKAMC